MKKLHQKTGQFFGPDVCHCTALRDFKLYQVTCYLKEDNLQYCEVK